MALGLGYLIGFFSRWVSQLMVFGHVVWGLLVFLGVGALYVNLEE